MKSHTQDKYTDKHSPRDVLCDFGIVVITILIVPSVVMIN